MELELINQIIRLTLIIAAFCSLGTIFLYSWSEAIGLIAGAIWSCLNLYIIKHLIQNWVVLEPRNYKKIGWISALKFPLLYFSLYVLVKVDLFPTWSLLVGLSIIVFVIFVEVLGYGLRSLSKSKG